ncbi:MAG: hypothetical protein Q4F29_06770 [Lachnospiraceae bacterium]|nr:hypothetical protein [Lachnospiraceae bacterium]
MAAILFFLFVFLKQFYIFPSGSLGVADICLAGCFLVLIFEGRKAKKPFLNRKTDLLFCLFLVFVILINGSYGLYGRNLEYFKYSLFWIYNGCAIWSFQRLSEAGGKRFFSYLNLVVKGNIVIQLVVMLSRHGRVFEEYWGATRYMGTFNDPNQLAFFLFMMILLSYMYRCCFEDKTFWIFFVLGFPVVLASKSTGILLGIGVFLLSVLLCQVFKVYRSRKYSGKVWFISGVCISAVSAAFLIWIWPPSDFSVQAVEYNMLTRIQEKIWKVAHGGLLGMILDRGIEKILVYPEYLVLGAGEGGFERFALVSQVNEIHSSFLSIWFCYGTIPAVTLAVWVFDSLKKMRGRMWCAAAALLAESFLLVNYRQPMFWMILMYGWVTIEFVPKRTTSK